MKFSLICGLLVLASIKVYHCDYIVWDNRKLQSGDFRLVDEDVGGYKRVAITNAKISVKLIQNGDKLRYIVCNHFSKEKSWRKKSSFSPYILNHEQRHFDISEIYTRRIRKSLDSLSSLGIKEYKVIFKKHFKENQQFSKLYDSETKHSLDTIEQNRWNLLIDRELEKLDDFKYDEDQCPCFYN